MATPIKSLFPPIEKKPFLLNKKKAGAVARRRVSTQSMRPRDISALMISESLGPVWAVESLRRPCYQFVDDF